MSASAESYQELHSPLTQVQDIEWISKYVGDTAQAKEIFPELEKLAQVGSTFLSSTTIDSVKETVLQAREQFLLKIGVEQQILDRLRKSANHPMYLVPTTTFIETQRGMDGSLIDLPAIYQLHPRLLNSSADSMRKQFVVDNNSPTPEDFPILPSELTAAYHNLPYEQRHGIEHLFSLGIDPTPFLKGRPDRRMLTASTIDQRLLYLAKEGLDAFDIVKRNPDALLLSSEKIKTKLTNLQSLGLNAVELVSKYPKILSSGERSIAQKTRLIHYGLGKLEWKGDPNEIILAHPSILTASKEKLMMLLRLASMGASADRQTMSPHSFSDILINPIEYPIIALGSILESNLTSKDIFTESTHIKGTLSAKDRHDKARGVLDMHRRELGKIAFLYQRSESKQHTQQAA